MLTNEIRAVIPGHPAPKGSLKCIGGGKDGRGHQLIEDNKNTKPWRDKLGGWLKTKWPEHQIADKHQPVGAEVTITVDRPPSHYGTGRNATKLKESAPRYPVGHNTGDVDKHARLTLDALQDAGVFPDDCAVVELNVRKAYVGCEWTPDALGYPGVVIRVFPMQEPGDR